MSLLKLPSSGTLMAYLSTAVVIILVIVVCGITLQGYGEGLTKISNFCENKTGMQELNVFEDIHEFNCTYINKNGVQLIAEWI